MFQPSHGTAPQLAGKNIANPIATILSATMLRDWRCDRHDDPAVRSAAVRTETTVASLLVNGKLQIADQGGIVSTSNVAVAVAAAISQTPSPGEAPSVVTPHKGQ